MTENVRKQCGTPYINMTSLAYYLDQDFNTDFQHRILRNKETKISRKTTRKKNKTVLPKNHVIHKYILHSCGKKEKWLKS